MVARGNEKVLKARGPHDNMLINIEKKFRVLWFIMIIPITNFNGPDMIVSAKKDVNQKIFFSWKQVALVHGKLWILFIFNVF